MTMNNMPEDVLQCITWPLDVLYDENGFVGYVMKRVKSVASLSELYSDTKYNLHIRMYAAYNLCAAIDTIHSVGQVCGDLNPRNICINLDGNDKDVYHVTLVDADSYHFVTEGTIYRCEVGLADYLAPEIQQKISGDITLKNAPLPTFTRETDLFALAVHVFSLLMNGSHPFACAKKENGNVTNNPLDKNGENVFGLKPYISYSVKYNPNSDLDIVITYSLDNYISIKGMVKVDGEKQYWDKSGYLIDGIKKDASGKITYNGVEIDKNVVLSEDLPAIGSLEKGTYKYVRYNGTKYYLDERNARVIYFLNGNLMEINPTSDYDKYKDMIEKGESLSEELPQIGTLARGNYKYIVYNGTKYYLDERNTRIIYFLNGNLMEIKPKLDENIESSYKKYENMIENGESAYKFYDEANKFTQSVKNVLANLTNKDAQDFIINSNGETIQTTVFSDETEYKIFDFNSDSSKPEKNIECRSSNFNQHRLAVIKNKIRTNLAIAITNFNSAYNIEFQMPELTEEDWAKAMNNISLISFIQGIDIGGKTYNGYTIINNSESKEVVREEKIYILGNDGFYHRIGDKYLLEANNIGGNSEYNSNVNASGRLNLDFNKQRAYTEDGSTVYYYPISKYYASYNSIVNQNYWDKDYDNYNDIYAYVATKNVNLRKAFYMALGRERYGMYKSN